MCLVLAAFGCGGKSPPVLRDTYPYVAAAGAGSGSASCGAELDLGTRDELARMYECSNSRIRCFDGQTGEVFVGSSDRLAQWTPGPGGSGSAAAHTLYTTGYFNAHRFYQSGAPGEQLKINVFARADCAAERLSGLTFGVSTVQSSDSADQTTGAGAGSAQTMLVAARDVWPSVHVNGVDVASVTHMVEVPAGDDTAFIQVTISNLEPGAGSAANQVWPDSIMTIKVNHGSYHRDFGYMFAAIFQGQRIRDNAVTWCPEACRTAFQSMIAGTLFLGRDKGVIAGGRNWLPGLQVGINADLTKISDAISLGLAWEPINGLSLSGGVMYYSRVLDATAAPAADGSLPTQHKFLPFVGITLTSEFYDTIKGLAGSTSETGTGSGSG